MSEHLVDGGIGGLIAGLILFAAQQLFQSKLAERLARLEAQLNTQSQWMAARLTRVDERRAKAISHLHTLMDRALHLTEDYIGFHDASNDPATLEELRFSCARCWMSFNNAFERAEIYLSEALAERIRTYSHTISDIKIKFDASRDKLIGTEDLPTRLQTLNEAFRQLTKLHGEIRPQLLREFRAELGADRINA